MKYISFIFYAIVLLKAGSALLPAYEKECNKNDPNFEQCLADNMNAAIQANPEGDGYFNKVVPAAEEVIMSGGPLNVTLQNVFVEGAENSRITNLQIFPANQSLIFTVVCPQYIWHHNYTANLNDDDDNNSENDEDNEIEGEGELHYDNGIYLMTYQYVPNEMNGTQHYNVTNGDIEFEQCEIVPEMEALENNPKFKAAWDNLLQQPPGPGVKKFITDFWAHYLNEALENYPIE